MAVVVDLNPLWRCVQFKGLGQPTQQFGLRRCFRHLSGQRFLGIAGGVGNQFGLFTALRDNDLDLAACFFGKRLGHQVRVIEPM